MGAKEIHFRDDARRQILSGATLLYDAVRVTLGPKSKCVLIEKSFGRPLVCNDGVTIAKGLSPNKSGKPRPSPSAVNRLKCAPLIKRYFAAGARITSDGRIRRTSPSGKDRDSFACA